MTRSTLRPVAAAAWLALCGLFVHVQAATVVLDPTQQHQTIEGFGTMMKQDIGPGDSLDVADSAYRQLLVNDLGLTVIRVWAPMAFTAPNRFTGGGGDDIRWIYYIINHLKQYADMKFIAAVLSPPAWMKDNGSVDNGGHVLATMYDSLGEYLSAFYKAVHDSTGVNLYGVSIQNEPAFSESYGSCVYTTAEYHNAFKAVGARFARDGIVTNLHGADDMLTNINTNGYFGTLNADTTTRRYVSALSVHGYTNGVDPLPTSGAAQSWSLLGTRASAMGGKKAWMTEGSGWNQTDLIPAALHLGMALRYANLSMWVYLAPNDCSVAGLFCNRQYTLVAAAHKHYYHWVRPGAIRIDANYTDSSLLVTAFYHPLNHTLTVVAVNTASGTHYLHLTGPSTPATMQRYSSLAPSRMCNDDGNVATSDSTAIEGNSVVTLFGQNYNPTAVISPASRLSTSGSPVAIRAQARYYRLDGVRVDSPRTPGVYYLGVPGAGSARSRVEIGAVPGRSQ